MSSSIAQVLARDMCMLYLAPGTAVAEKLDSAQLRFLAQYRSLLLQMGLGPSFRSRPMLFHVFDAPEGKSICYFVRPCSALP